MITIRHCLEGDIIWTICEAGKTVGTRGSENGTIIKDEDHTLGARITLEESGYTPFGIACRVYGLMVHTVFASSYDEAISLYKRIKLEIDRFLKSDDLDSENWREQFTGRF